MPSLSYYAASPKDGIYAQLSARLPNESSNKPLPAGWSVLQRCDQRESDGYWGIAYQHQATGQLVVAHHGVDLSNHDTTSWLGRFKASFNELSQFSKSIDITISGVLRLMVTSQQISALQFVETLLQRYPDLAVSSTGYLLGGWLAELCTYHLVVSGHYSWAVTFDSPGAKNIIRELHARYSDVIPASKLDSFLERLDVTSYLSSPHLLNCGEHLGTAYRLYLAIEQATKAKATQWAISAMVNDICPMQKIAAAFDPLSGDATQRSQVTDWPKIKWLDHKALALQDREGPAQLLAEIAKTFIPLPSILGKLVDKRISAFMDSCGKTQGFYQLTQVLYDIVMGKVDTSEYQGFFSMARY